MANDRVRFRSAEALQARIDAYFSDCAGEILKDEETGSPVLDKKGKPVMVNAHPPTPTGLALALGFTGRSEMAAFRGNERQRAAIDRAISRITLYAEERLYDKESCSGARFMLTQQAEAVPGEAGTDGGYADILDGVRRRLRQAEAADDDGG